MGVGGGQENAGVDTRGQLGVQTYATLPPGALTVEPADLQHHLDYKHKEVAAPHEQARGARAGGGHHRRRCRRDQHGQQARRGKVAAKQSGHALHTGAVQPRAGVCGRVGVPAPAVGQAARQERQGGGGEDGVAEQNMGGGELGPLQQGGDAES